MLNITREFVLLTLCGALLGAGSSASHASNVYSAAPSQSDEVGVTESQPRYWACPAEYRVCPTQGVAVTAKADDPNVRTDATVWDAPQQPTRSLEDERQHYTPPILGD